MKDTKLEKQTVFMMLGIPGSGKTFFARQFAHESGAIHLSFDRIKDTIFGNVETNEESEKRCMLS